MLYIEVTNSQVYSFVYIIRCYPSRICLRMFRGGAATVELVRAPYCGRHDFALIQNKTVGGWGKHTHRIHVYRFGKSMKLGKGYRLFMSCFI